MISKKIESALNEQIGLEAYASFLYLAMASWCDREGLEGCASFMHRQSDEERAHMLRIYSYLSETDGYALTPAIAQAPHEYDSVQAMFEKVYAHEQKVTQSINDLISLSYAENDHSTLNFLQWYVEEQREEEALMRNILNKIRLIGTGGQSLYYIDKEVDKLNKAAIAQESTEEEN
ncbi:MAG TPA: ferritin [Haliscomenobacter sp.]|uniref:ferritin n=1 Tax=Haliscomenobacter sp. TaxID=2717303 RepID=UPI001D9A693A|nr:ferritin [Haliscomenobacter sp.]MBK9492414.1 ferritin [Haliscomenobacter sp.]HOY20015.1 ferritin [Haliscomenobacter sp.]HPH17220.1 ferritin [Haliscomenobacter sp.]